MQILVSRASDICVARLNVGEPVFHLPARLFGPSELLPGVFALDLERGQCLRKDLPARALAFDGPGHGSRQFGLERRVGHHVSVGAGIECGERRFEPRGSSDDHDWRRQTKAAELLDERGAALRLHLDDDSRGVAVVFAAIRGRRPVSGPTSNVTFRAIS